MSLELKRLMESVATMDITLVAGEGGILNLVNWVHMVETIDAAEFLTGGELAFVTGVGLNETTTLTQLIKKIEEKGAAGVVVNTGPFIENLPQDAIEYCNMHSFPILVVPWRIHLSEIMRIICFNITRDDQKNLAISAAFKNAIFYPNQEELYVVPLSQRNFQLNWRYCVCVVEISNPQTDLNSRLETISMTLDNYLHHKYANFAVFTNDRELLAVVANYDESTLHSFVKDLKNRAKMMLMREEEFHLGVGKLTKSVRCLYKSYHQAQSIRRLQANNKISQSLCFYSDMGIYQLLMGVEDRDIIAYYYENTIQPLISYDEQNNSDLTDVLRCYLAHDGSVKETADELFVHRNTINYKLNKIEEILDLNLSSINARLQLTLGLMIQDMI